MSESITEPLSMFGVDTSSAERLDSLHLGGGGVIESRRIDALMDLSRQQARPGTYYFSDVDPLPQLVVQNPAFRAEAFQTNGALYYISRKLRAMLPFTESEVEYLPIDDSLSLPRFRAQEFLILHPIVTEDAADPVKSVRPTWEEEFPYWSNIPLAERFEVPYREIVLRADFRPRARIFRISGVRGPFVTPDLARQIIDLPDIGVYPAPHIRNP